MIGCPLNCIKLRKSEFKNPKIAGTPWYGIKNYLLIRLKNAKVGIYKINLILCQCLFSREKELSTFNRRAENSGLDGAGNCGLLTGSSGQECVWIHGVHLYTVHSTDSNGGILAWAEFSTAKSDCYFSCVTVIYYWLIFKSSVFSLYNNFRVPYGYNHRSLALRVDSVHLWVSTVFNYFRRGP